MSYGYSDLLNDIVGYTHRSDLGALAPNFVARSEQEIYKRLAVPENRSTGTGTADATNPFVVATELWAQVTSLYQTSGNRIIDPGSASQIKHTRRQQQDAGTFFPANYQVLYRTMESTVLELNWVDNSGPTNDYVIDGHLHPAAGLAANDTLAVLLLGMYPNVFLYAALVEAYTYTANPDKTLESRDRYGSELMTANTNGQRLQWGAGLSRSAN